MKDNRVCSALPSASRGYTLTHAHTHTHTHTRVHARTHARTHAHTHARTHTHTHTCTHTHTNTHILTHTPSHPHTHTDDNSNSSCDSDQLQQGGGYHANEEPAIPVYQTESISVSDMEKCPTMLRYSCTLLSTCGPRLSR